ncbi:MAG TPA: RcpC/CpaB family pilus assembly protein [Acidimicrobiia bacterium]|nr:RcpC/CpaB family pilus assembly protein [Acidimicrobiia bacterium]
MSALGGILAGGRARRLRRVDGRLVLGIVLVAVSVLGGLRLVAAADHTVTVLAAARDLPADHVVTRGDVRVTRVRTDGAVLGSLVRDDRPDALVGRVLVAPVARDALIPSAAVGRGPVHGREMTVPITPEHALGGAVRVGDRVDVLATFAKGGKDARTLTVVHDAQVVDTVRTKGILGDHAGDLSAVTLSVRPDDAVYLAFALHTAEVDVVRAGGDTSSARTTFEYSDLP